MRCCCLLMPLLGAVSLAYADSPAQAAPAPVTTTLTPSFVSQYMFRGLRIGGPSFEPSVEVDSGNLAVGVWSNFPIADKVPGQSDPEIDPYVSYTFALNDRFSLTPELQAYTYPRADTGAGSFRATLEPSIALNASVGEVKLTPKLYYDVVLQSPTLELNASAAVPLKSIGSEIDFLATYGGYTAANYVNTATTGGPHTRAWGGYWLAGASLPFQLSASAKLTVGYAYTRGFDSASKQGNLPQVTNAQAVGRSVFSLALAYTF